MSPQKINIPERYNPDDDVEELSAAEKLKRGMKAEMIRKMLSESTIYEDLRRDIGQQHQPTTSSSRNSTASSSSLTGDSDSKVKMSEEKRRRAQLLALNHELAKEVMERSRYVAGKLISTFILLAFFFSFKLIFFFVFKFILIIFLANCENNTH